MGTGTVPPSAPMYVEYNPAVLLISSDGYVEDEKDKDKYINMFVLTIIIIISSSSSNMMMMTIKMTATTTVKMKRCMSRILVGRRLLGRIKHRWAHNIKMHLK